jgi:hypothetical protein
MAARLSPLSAALGELAWLRKADGTLIFRVYIGITARMMGNASLGALA